MLAKDEYIHKEYKLRASGILGVMLRIKIRQGTPEDAQGITDRIKKMVPEMPQLGLCR